MTRDCRCAQVRHEHGTEQAYITDRCRCGDCKRAHAERAAWRRKQYAYGRDISHLVPAVGACRRLEALAWLGYSDEALGARLGWDARTLHRLRQQARLTSIKAAAVGSLFDELWNRPPATTNRGERISVNRTRALARRRGYAPPLAWDDIDNPDEHPTIAPANDVTVVDEIAVAEAMKGRPVSLTRAERAEVIRRLTERGVSARQIGALLGRAARSVERHRARQSEAA